MQQPNYQHKKGCRIKIKKNKKMERFEGSNCFLSTYCYVATTVLQQLSSSVALKIATTPCRPPIIFAYHLHCLQTLLWLLLTIYNTFKPFVVIAYCLQRLQTFCGCFLPFTTMLFSCRPQISCLPFCYYLPMVTTVLWQKVFFYSLKTTTESR